jgi:UDP-2,3-diacylglucosamine hydrolase
VPSSLFISDLHLSEERPEANERFFTFIEDTASRAGAVYILGDLFEYWIGDDDLAEAFNALIAGFLRNLSRSGVALSIMQGNRDFLMGAAFCEAAGARLLEDPTVVDIGGTATLLMHGDTLCTDDLDYQEWRRVARSADWQKRFLAQPLARRREAVLELREKSRKALRSKPAKIMDVNEEAVRQAFRRHGVARMIHGHTHLPAHHLVDVDGQKCERWVLPDWYATGGYLEVATGKPKLVRF